MTLATLICVWCKKLRLGSAAGTIAVVMLILLQFLNTDALVAKVNISRYLDYGKDIDYYYLSSAKLSSAAVPEVMRLYEEGSKEDKEKAKVILSSYYRYVPKYSEKRFGTYNAQDFIAEKILRDNEIKKYQHELSLKYDLRHLSD